MGIVIGGFVAFWVLFELARYKKESSDEQNRQNVADHYNSLPKGSHERKEIKNAFPKDRNLK